MHDAYWRIDIDLIDSEKNSAMIMRHLEDPQSLSAEDLKEPFNGGVEGGMDWDPKEFSMIRIESERLNANGKKMSYDLLPMKWGHRGIASPLPSTIFT